MSPQIQILSPIIVIKVGGSLLEWPPLPGRLARFLDARRTQGARLVLIAGGGGAANWIRQLDRVHAFGEARSHHLAVRSLDLTAHALQLLLDDAEVVETRAEIENAWKTGRIPILAPRRLLDEDEQTATAPLPRSWDSTTDSIAARIAAILHADQCLLLKSTSVDPNVTTRDAAERGVVDPVFPIASQGVPSVCVVNLRDDNPSEIPLLPSDQGRGRQ